jgi:hypothetical protein
LASATRAVLELISRLTRVTEILSRAWFPVL